MRSKSNFFLKTNYFKTSFFKKVFHLNKLFIYLFITIILTFFYTYNTINSYTLECMIIKILYY